ncbi:MAG: SDR family oxidoreductase [Novosphingobium sp.]|jgi:NAD(P)-dependent dehydrogenase (short-subunit alcohol dehydrogenase family)|nr:SDR family oxidoreductase [Novosphingobium sp.]
MDLQLAGKRALVTGSSSGIGAAIARELAAEGCAVVVHGRDRARADAVARECMDRGVQAAVAPGAITDDAGADAVADAAFAAFGGIDILVNAAGGTVRGDNPAWTEVTSDEWLLSFSLNVVSVIRLARRLIPGMAERGWGRIINISSIGGTQLSGRLLDYGAAKAALDHLTGNLSCAVASQGITVNAIVPGTVLTPQAERWIGTVAAQQGWPDDFTTRERLYTQDFAPQPVPRLGRVQEIAAATAFLASPRSDFTTGALLRIDGGNTRTR